MYVCSVFVVVGDWAVCAFACKYDQLERDRYRWGLVAAFFSIIFSKQIKNVQQTLPTHLSPIFCQFLSNLSFVGGMIGGVVGC